MKKTSIKIGKKLVGNNSSCYIIAEIGSNFDGSLSKAKKLIQSAKNCGADAAKFQTFQTEKILSKKGFEKKTTFHRKWGKSVWDVYKKAEFPIKWHKEINQYCKKIGIDFLSTPYFFDAVDILVKLNVPAIKIGSGEITNLDFLKYIGKTKKPIFLATGASTMKEVEQAVKTIRKTGNNKIFLMQTITQYPSPIEQANLKVLETFQKKFGLNVGYSDHSLGDLIVLASITLGASVIEKHFTLDRKSKGPDHLHSMEPKSFKQMVTNIRILEKAMGDGVKKIEDSEKETRIIQRRGMWTIKKVVRGQKFNRENIQTLRPVMGIQASMFSNILGKKAKKTMKPFTPIKKGDF